MNPTILEFLWHVHWGVAIVMLAGITFTKSPEELIAMWDSTVKEHHKGDYKFMVGVLILGSLFWEIAEIACLIHSMKRR